MIVCSLPSSQRIPWIHYFLFDANFGQFLSLLVAFKNTKTSSHSEIKQTRPSTKQNFSGEALSKQNNEASLASPSCNSSRAPTEWSAIFAFGVWSHYEVKPDFLSFFGQLQSLFFKNNWSQEIPTLFFPYSFLLSSLLLLQYPFNFSFLAIDGNYTEWSEWSECSVTCDGGFQTRTRQCSSPPPQYGGKGCEELGPTNETQECNTNSCRKFQRC